MKKLYVLLLAVGMMFATSQEAKACWGFSWKQHRYQKKQESKADYKKSGDHDGAVGAPLDGGLLMILAAAGGTYFVARKKKKNMQ